MAGQCSGLRSHFRGAFGWVDSGGKVIGSERHQSAESTIYTAARVDETGFMVERDLPRLLPGCDSVCFGPVFSAPKTVLNLRNTTVQEEKRSVNQFQRIFSARESH